MRRFCTKRVCWPALRERARLILGVTLAVLLAAAIPTAILAISYLAWYLVVRDIL